MGIYMGNIFKEGIELFQNSVLTSGLQMPSWSKESGQSWDRLPPAGGDLLSF